MIINANTKIASLLKGHPQALEAIVTISPKFGKLRNPVLRKMIAGRTSIAMASKLGGCSVDHFFEKLQPLGFVIDKIPVATDEHQVKEPMPGFIKDLQPGSLIELDVRPVIDSGSDPLVLILQKIKNLQAGFVLRIINSFEPAPLMQLLQRQGFESYAERINDQLVNTYFYKKTGGLPLPANTAVNDTIGWDEILEHFKDNIQIIDVRNLEMPLPMHTILEALGRLPVQKALFVYHKRIPVFLLPELEAQHFSFRVKEISDTEVHMLIYKSP